ncbi:uncharacterized protein MYCFIDRAFT_207463 [Pseudocercospora fijiensis CIRAD86]|uniref:Uncharacterized protein n=1 Tax=Pseudocercospora fijiensis (strain CIRAD86) TaxID=383855 RepID=M3B6R1_PSEFD|nr:uncharacterized protein MYCFIDRAFT_207463 [Pseudocercospora fijiensis CIRAD86]EME85028.1 hypothetical protein MYCFIDRAFT_207463 [Pseudocercospora fijiensis CIRAD86]
MAPSLSAAFANLLRFPFPGDGRRAQCPQAHLPAVPAVTLLLAAVRSGRPFCISGSDQGAEHRPHKIHGGMAAQHIYVQWYETLQHTRYRQNRTLSLGLLRVRRDSRQRVPHPGLCLQTSHARSTTHRLSRHSGNSLLQIVEAVEEVLHRNCRLLTFGLSRSGSRRRYLFWRLVGL